MKEEIRCPKCGSVNLKKEIKCIAVGGTSKDRYPKGEKRIVYTCLDCGEVFFEEDLRNQRGEKPPPLIKPKEKKGEEEKKN